jgi:cation:H+ antiporter
MLLAIILLLVGFVVLIKGADFLVSGSSSIAKKFNISNIAIGLTVVALGTSTPELLVSITSSMKGYNSAAFGNVIGSNNFNLLFILGIAGLIYPLAIQRNTVKYEVPFSLLAAGVFLFLVNDQFILGSDENQLSRLDSIILLFFFSLFMLYVFRTMSNASDFDQESEIKVMSNPASIGLIILGLVMLVGGGTLVVDNAIIVAENYGLSKRLIGLTILAIGTSLPELATSAVAAYKRNTDIAIGNVIGSNIFNVFFILPITGLIKPMSFDTAMNFDLGILLTGTILLIVFMFTWNKRKLDRWEAFLLLVGYFAYVWYLISMG